MIIVERVWIIAIPLVCANAVDTCFDKSASEYRRNFDIDSAAEA